MSAFLSARSPGQKDLVEVFNVLYAFCLSRRSGLRSLATKHADLPLNPPVKLAPPLYKDSYTRIPPPQSA